MENRIYLNNGWKFAEEYCEEMTQVSFDASGLEDVRLPHTCKELPFHYFDEKLYQMVTLYRKTFHASKEWQDRCVLLTLDGVAHESEVFLNGEKIGEHHSGYTAFTIDISEKVKYDEENVLAVKVDSRESNNIPPFGFVIDYLTYGGIYRDVYLEVKNPTYIKDVFLQSEVSGQSAKVLKAEVEIQNPNADITIAQYIREKNKGEYTLLGTLNPDLKKASTSLCWDVKDIALWSTDEPNLYEIKTQLLCGEKLLDEVVHSFGFRSAEFKKDGFYLNGKKFKIRGLNRHQSYPYVGYAMPKSMQVMDANVLKNELGLNAVRTSHYPQSHDFLDRCDELGLLVFTEIPGWQHIGDDKWQQQAVVNTEEMVKQYRNHTSIILWGVRINESQDNDAFYEKTNAVARKLDPTRPTAGVRAHKKSSLLEDVYTYNDFSHDGKAHGCEPKKNVTSNMEKAYFISEYNGHMFPTKSFDCEEHRVEHAIRHANVLNAVAGYDDIAGSFGWCMADYNTHKDFGSGDRICYHGVLDMFRNPKMAADIYASQQEKEVHLSIASSMDIGEHPACNRGNTWIFTNADSVKMYKNDRFIKEYTKSHEAYENMIHGPILIDDYIGDAIVSDGEFTPKQAEDIKYALNQTALHGLSHLPKKVLWIALKLILVYGMKPTQAIGLYNKYIGDWGGTSTVYKFEAIKDGKVAKTIVKQPMKEIELVVKTDHTNLVETHCYDVAAVRIQAQDENGNVLPFYQEPMFLEVSGPIEIIGGNVVGLKGGMGGTYVKTTGGEGAATLTIRDTRGNCKQIEFAVSKEACNERQA